VAAFWTAGIEDIFIDGSFCKTNPIRAMWRILVDRTTECMIASILIGSISRWFWSRKFGNGSGGCGRITASSFSSTPLCGQNRRSGSRSFPAGSRGSAEGRNSGSQV
jgi:hypothetical protein